MAWRAAAAVVLLAAAALRPSSAPAVAEPSPPIVTYRSDQLSVRLEKVPLEDVLAELGRVSGAEIRGAPREPRDLTAKFDDVPLPEALHRLLGDQNFILKYGEADRLRMIELFGGPQEPRNASSTSPAAGLSAVRRLPPVRRCPRTSRSRSPSWSDIPPSRSPAGSPRRSAATPPRFVSSSMLRCHNRTPSCVTRRSTRRWQPSRRSRTCAAAS